MRANLWMPIAAWLVAAFAGPARASPPCDCEYGWSLPDNEATGVPTNARIFVWWPQVADEDFELRTQPAPSQPVAIVVTDAGAQPGARWITPTAELAPQTGYVLEAQLPGGGSLALRFETAAGPDGQPPVAGTIDILAGTLSGACPAHIAAVVSVSGASDDTTPSGRLVIRVDLVDPQREPGTSTVYLHPIHPILGDMGADSCLDNAPGAEPGRQYQATVRLLDWAGNQSPISEPIAFAFRDNPGCCSGCGCAPIEPPGQARLGWVFVALCLLALARRWG